MERKEQADTLPRRGSGGWEGGKGGGAAGAATATFKPFAVPKLTMMQLVMYVLLCKMVTDCGLLGLALGFVTGAYAMRRFPGVENALDVVGLHVAATVDAAVAAIRDATATGLGPEEPTG